MKPNIGLIGSIDQGTSSTRFIIFSAENGSVITYHQIEVARNYPQRGWVEQNPLELFETVLQTCSVVHQKLIDLNLDPGMVRCIGLTNQRESCVAWDRLSGQPLCDSIVWLDNRTTDLVESFLDRIPERDLNVFKHETGLPIATYFTALKIRWLLDNDPSVQLALHEDRLMIGTVDSWILWKLTGYHGTDVTNASRTMLMNIMTMDWDQDLCEFFHVPSSILPRIHPSSNHYGFIRIGSFQGVPITGIIGDQNAALVGQQCFQMGGTKITFGTGCFLQQNLGPGPLEDILRRCSHQTKQNLIITVAYQFGPEQPVHYALEGSVAIAGAAFTWLRDNLQLVENYAQIEMIAQQDDSSRGLYFVPALQGLYAPYWDPNASGTIIGLTQFTRKCHLVRATIEGVGYQINDILEMLIHQDDVPIKVDGGLSSNDILCQFLANISGRRIIRADMTESTALGAAMVAAYTLKLWPELCQRLQSTKVLDDEEIGQATMFIPKYDVFHPKWTDQNRLAKIESWRSAVERSRDWIRLEQTEKRKSRYQRLSMLPLMMFVLVSFATHIYSRLANG